MYMVFTELLQLLGRYENSKLKFRTEKKVFIQGETNHQNTTFYLKPAMIMKEEPRMF